MTEGRTKELAEEWWEKGADEYDQALFSDQGHKMLTALIRTVAAEAREEGRKEGIEEAAQEIESLIVANECAHDDACPEWRYTGRALQKAKAAVYSCIKRLKEKP